jgi:hypothetical protein
LHETEEEMKPGDAKSIRQREVIVMNKQKQNSRAGTLGKRKINNQANERTNE